MDGQWYLNLPTNTMISKVLSCFLFLFCILCKLDHVESRTTGNETEIQALLAFKARIPVDPFGVFDSWNDSQHFCNWRGVTCGRRHRRVTALHLSSLKLAGDLSPYIANLTFLRVIKLGTNSFRGVIPREVTRLHRLEELVLANNSFQGELPRNLSRCSNLKVINLGGNSIGGEVHAKLGYLSRLQTLELPINNFIGTIPPSLGNISSLLYLSLKQNHLEGNIPHELGQLSNLKFFQLGLNNLSGTVPKQLYNISSIYLFSLAGNQLQGQIPAYLGLSLPNLEDIFLGGNQFSGPIPTSIVNSSGLLALDLAYNALSGSIPKNLGSLQNLQILNFGNNFLESSNDLSFLNSLANCTNLGFLFLYQNNLTGVLPNSIGNLSANLSQLSIETNYISGTIPKEIENLVGLELLGLYENMLTGSIPDGIGKLSTLKYFYACTNRIIGGIPASLGNMTQLMELLLEANLLGGEIPASLGNCSHLERMDLSQNFLKGTIPKEAIGFCSSARALSFASNALTGALPPEVGNCKNLNFLDVASNKLHGEIPSSLANCVMLESLFLQGNSFEGIIPSSFQKLRSLQDLDVSNNNLSGQIPEYLGELPFLTNLNLSFNSFQGKVPMNGVFDNISEFSIVGNNELCGGIKPLRLHTCPTEIAKRSRNFPRRAIIVTGIVLFVVLFLICLFAIKRRVSLSKKREGVASPLEKKHLKLSYAELLHATDNFSSANLIEVVSPGSVPEPSSAGAGSYSSSTPFTNKSISIRLDESNYLLWGQQVLFAIESLALGSHIDGSTAVPSHQQPYKLDDVCNVLLNTEARQQEAHSIPVNFAQGRGGRVYGGRSRPQCQLCGRVGHLVNRCYYRFDQSYDGFYSANFVEAVDVQNTDMESTATQDLSGTVALVYGDFSSIVCEDASWFPDSSATTHLTPDAGMIRKSTPYVGTGKISVANGESVSISRVGNGVLSSNSRSLVLTNLLHVPSIKKNLLSVSKFTKDNNVSVEFYFSDSCVVKDLQTHRVMLQGVKSNGLYKLSSSSLLQQPPCLSQCLNVVQNDEFMMPKLWNVASRSGAATAVPASVEIQSRELSFVTPVNNEVQHSPVVAAAAEPGSGPLVSESDVPNIEAEAEFPSPEVCDLQRNDQSLRFQVLWMHPSLSMSP
ncbi:hypothetical protein GQ457_02G039060 [Hibiscus cannabinus]